jgi:hypothetical protein
MTFVTVLVTVVFVGVLSGSVHAARVRGPTCKAKPATWIVKGKDAYAVRQGPRLYGCLRRSGRGVHLTTRGDFLGSWRIPTVAGSVVGFEEDFFSATSSVRTVRTINLRSRHTCVKATAGTTAGFRSAPGFGAPLTALRVTQTGAAAWIDGPGVGPALSGQFDDVAPWSGYEVMISDSQGTRQVAAGAAIDPAYLQFRGPAVVFREHGVERTAAITEGPHCSSPVSQVR